MPIPLSDQPGKSKLPIEQGDDLMLDALRFTGPRVKTRICPAGSMTRQAAVRRDVV
jgi:hypothetical protein